MNTEKFASQFNIPGGGALDEHSGLDYAIDPGAFEGTGKALGGGGYRPRINSKLDVEYALAMDQHVRDVVDLLRENRSILILHLDQPLETQEEQAGGELYTALINLARCRKLEDEKTALVERQENSLFEIVKTKYSGLKPTHQPTMTEMRKEARLDPNYELAQREARDSQEERRQAEAYVEALKLKLSLIPGAQGARNHSV